MAVYSPAWEFLGYIEDEGTKASERIARDVFQTSRVRLVPAFGGDGRGLMRYRLSILLLSAPFLLFTRLAGFYTTPNAVWFAVYLLGSALCVIAAIALWCLSVEEPVNEHT